MNKVHESSFWEALARCEWRRRKWHQTDGSPESEQCLACGIPIHRRDAYYLRPAYTDGTRWLCQTCYLVMARSAGLPVHRKYGRGN